MKKTKQRISLPPDLRSKLQLLRRKTSVVSKVTAYLDASTFMEQLAIDVERVESLLTASHVRTVRVSLDKWHARNLKSYSVVHYANETVGAAANVLFFATRAYFRRLSGESVDSKGKDFERLKAYVRDCVGTLICLCESSNELSWRYPIVYLRRVCKTVGIDLDEFLSTDVLGQNYSLIEGGVIKAIKAAIDREEPDQIELIFASVPGHDLKESMIAALAKLLSEQAARLPSEVQQSIMGLLGVSPGTQSAEYVNPAESPQARQMAAFLLHLRDEAQRTSTLEKTFQRFRLLCEKEFKLFLHGDVGAKMKFDPRIHEGTQKPNGQVKLLRPWVELVDPPRAYVVIRGLVEPIDS